MTGAGAPRSGAGEAVRSGAVTLRDLVARGEITAAAAVDACLDRIGGIDSAIGAFVTVDADGARAAAARIDGDRKAGRPLGPLAGVPIALKDILATAGLPTRCGSRILEPFVPPFDATLVARLRAAGAIVLGKTNMDEFAMGSSTENSAYQVTRNPWDPERVPGGSSGGSAAAVAADEAPVSIGTDTGGSIRQPAALCGVVGMKPTYGRVSRYGLVAFASSLDQAGPFANSVADCAAVLQAIAGHDAHDSTSAAEPVPDYAAALGQGIRGLRIGVPREYFPDGLDAEVAASVRAAIDIARGLGASVREVSLPHTEYAIPTYYILATAEASSNLARFDGVRYGRRAAGAKDLAALYQGTRGEGFGPEVKRRIMLGTYVLSSGYYDAYYLKGQKVRTLIRRDFDDAFGQVDLLVTPTSPTTAFRIGEKVDDPLAMYLSDIFTVTLNLAGLPGLSLPCGVSRAGLPIGLQIVGGRFAEATVLRLAAALEAEIGFRARRPRLPRTPPAAPSRP
ncbi:MAG TPA: Asp-tRNA(Asn)/Glu-tRNA(Gln) amidotransferase subunit GatA [Candidatus Polarisedimenticolia bacterium]|nr:Asp-tRNA(Asn)/Glu-tRNA(Gln) amidotransferase subunit GatA [Candidatus Polarisedimenticolia bacterium]